MIQKLNLKGCEFLSLGKFGEAADCFKEALQEKAANPVILNNLGNVYFCQERYNEAELCYLNSLDISSTYSKPYRNLGLLYQLQGRHEDAISAYRSYLNFHPDSGDVHHNLGLLYLCLNQLSLADHSFKMAANYLKPNSAQTATNLGIGAFYLGNLKQALSYYERALAFLPQYTPARYHQAIAFLSQGRVTTAIELLNHLLEDVPAHKPAQAVLKIAQDTHERAT